MVRSSCFFLFGHDCLFFHSSKYQAATWPLGLICFLVICFVKWQGRAKIFFTCCVWYSKKMKGGPFGNEQVCYVDNILWVFNWKIISLWILLLLMFGTQILYWSKDYPCLEGDAISIFGTTVPPACPALHLLKWSIQILSFFVIDRPLHNSYSIPFLGMTY